MDEMVLLRRWAELAGIPTDSVRSQFDLEGFFQEFRPEGEGIEQLLCGIEKCDEVTRRLTNVFRVSASSFQASDAYFIIRNTSSIEPQKALELLRSHFRAMAEVAEHEKEPDFASALRDLKEPVFVKTNSDLTRNPSVAESFDVLLYDIATDYISKASRSSNPIYLLSEPMYGIANDKYLQGYLLWPLLEDMMPQKAPFDSYFEMWAKGIAYTLPQDGVCQLYVPSSE